MVNKKAFSLVEIIIAISIITLLAVVGFSSMNSSSEKADNTKVMTDISTIKNALEAYTQESATLPMPGGNTNFYKIDTAYSHSYTWSETFWVYGSINESTIANKYLDTLPLDPRTNSYYAYGKTKATNEFEIASVILDNGTFSATVEWNYSAENGPYSLIRSYNGPDFVSNESTENLPYNPDELVLTAKAGWKIYHEGDLIKAEWSDLEIFFSDWTVSILENGWELLISNAYFKKDDNSTTYLKLALKVGKIWTQATHLNDDSEFQIYTDDTTAAVRWTIFSVDANSTETEIEVIQWEVTATKESILPEDVSLQTANAFEVNAAVAWVSFDKDADEVKKPNGLITETIKLTAWKKATFKRDIPNPSPTNTTITIPEFSKNSSIRDANKIVALVDKNKKLKQDKKLKLDKKVSKNCYLNGKEIENLASIEAYNKLSVPNGTTCPTFITRTCNNGVLLWDNAYKFDSCTVASPTQCTAYDDGWFASTVMDFWDSQTLTYTETVTMPPLAWDKVHHRTVTCNNDASYTFTNLPFTCETGYDKAGLVCVPSIECTAWLSVIEWDHTYVLLENLWVWDTTTWVAYNKHYVNDWDVCEGQVMCNLGGTSISYKWGHNKMTPTDYYIEKWIELWEITAWLPLYASAEYNTPWDLDLWSLWVISNFITEWYTNQFWNSSNPNWTNLSPYWTVIDNSKSFLTKNWFTWIILTHHWEGTSTADMLKYTWLDIDDNDDFKIEINVRIPSDATKHYLVSADNFNLYVQDWILSFNDWYTSFHLTSIPLTTWTFNTISVKRISDEVFLKVNTSAWKPTWKTNNEEIEDISIWAIKLWWNYILQINDIIDYVKLYK